MITAYIALGSNLGEPHKQLREATDAIGRISGCRLTACSPVYRSAAVGPGRQPNYLNAVAALSTSLAPHALLKRLQSIEARQGRRRGVRWGARTLDLDILLYGDLVMDGETLTIPHPRLRDRNFVLYPLHDIAPGLTLPCGTPIASLLERCSRTGLEVVEPQVESTADQEN